MELERWVKRVFIDAFLPLVDCPLGVTKKALAFSLWLATCSTSFLPFFLLLLLSLPSSYFLLECGRRGAAGRPRRRLGGGPRGTAATTGTPGGRPGLSRAPVRTPQSPKSHWGVWVGEARKREEMLCERRLGRCWT